MSTRISPYLRFSGEARAAMTFYQTVFGGELDVKTYQDLRATSDPSENDLVIHSILTAPTGIVVMGADVTPNTSFLRGDDFSVSLSGDDEAELTRYWNVLSTGGVVTSSFVRSAWGSLFGSCADQFGVRWLVNVTSDSSSAGTGGSGGGVREDT